MQLSVNQSNLSKALGIVSRAVSNRTTMPVLSNILLETQGEQLRLAATNREISISCWIDAEITTGGSVTIPARLLSEFVNSLPEEPVSLELDEVPQTLRLACGRHKASMKGISAFEFPLLPTYQADPVAVDVPVVTGDVICVEPGHLARIIGQVAFAAAVDESRPTLTGVETVIANKQLSMAATDGYRLSMATIKADTTADNAIIIPAKSLTEVARIANDATGNVTVVIAQNRNQVLFSFVGSGEWRRVDVVSELIDAKFPDYQSILPKECTTSATVDADALQKAVRVAMLFARDSSDIVRFAVKPEAEMLYVSAISDSGDNQSAIECKAEGDDIEIRFNGRYLQQALSVVETEVVMLELTTANRPGLWRMPNREEWTHVVMPMPPPR